MKLWLAGLALFCLQGIGCDRIAPAPRDARPDRVIDAPSGTGQTAATGAANTGVPPSDQGTVRGYGDAATNPGDGRQASARDDTNPFDGEWTVTWCDQSRPEADCGGFNLGLVQQGNRLCGTYDSARAGLTQIDEGGRVSGTANGENATLTIESERSGGKYTAIASISGDQLHWRLQDTLREADRDIDIIAIDEMLDRRPLQEDLAAKHAEIASDCQAQWSSK